MRLGMHRAPNAAINVQGGDTEGGASANTVPSSRGKEEVVRTKIAMMVAMVVVLVALVGSGAALAQTIGGAIQCQTVPCRCYWRPPGALRAGRRRGARQDDRPGRP